MNTMLPESPVARFRFKDAARFWEPRRVAYNLVLTAVVFAWLILTWPHFRPLLTFRSLSLPLVLAALANVCYCAAYLAEIPLQFFSGRALRGGRWGLWMGGTLFGVVLACYWIADEIYPFVQ